MNLTKKICYSFVFTALFAISKASADDADINISDFSAEKIQTQDKQYPFFFESQADFIGKTKISKGYFKEDKVQYAQGNAQAGVFIYGCPRHKEGIYFALGYTTTYLHWANNPWFDQSHYNAVNMSFGGVTERLPGWLWKAQVAINLDANEWDINDYANYDGLLWGRYQYCKNIGVHIGMIVQTGMQMDRVYPIIGADWRISKHWRLNLVFPVNISLEYIWNRKWSILLAGRTFDTRYRVHKQECHSKPLVRYTNIGAEFAVKFETINVSWNLHAGSTLGGRIRIANHSNHHPHRFKLKPSPYAGGEVTVKF